MLRFTRMFRRYLAFILCVQLALQGTSVLPALAQEIQIDPGFDPNRILEDEDIFDVNGMGYDRMVRFLRAKGTLADYRTPDIDGVPKTAAEIIWRIATSYKINPKYLLALIQKEQSLVEDSAPTQNQYDWAAGYGVCDSCKKDDPSIQEFKGFASQLEWAAKQHREKYLLQILANGTTRAGKAPGKAMVIDGLSVTPVNNATAMLYSYTPHIHGNLNLWRIWRRWFSLLYPDGTVVRAKQSGKAYLIRLGQKRQFASRSVMETLADPDKVVTVSDTELAAYPDGATIRYPKFALLRDSQKRIWLLTGDNKRHIADMAAFRKFGFNEDEVIDIDDDTDLDGYPTGPKINVKTEFPQGVVFMDKAAKVYWYVEDNVKHAIPDAVFLKMYFRGRTIKTMSAKTLASYETGDPYAFHDGELVRGRTASAVYVVADGVLRPIPSPEIFETLGWSWRNVVMVPDAVVSRYTVGDPLTLEPIPASTPLETATLPSGATSSLGSL